MRRILMMLTVVALMAAMLAVMAAPAFAQVPPPQNCESGQLSAAFNALTSGDLDRAANQWSLWCAPGALDNR